MSATLADVRDPRESGPTNALPMPGRTSPVGDYYWALCGGEVVTPCEGAFGCDGDFGPEPPLFPCCSKIVVCCLVIFPFSSRQVVVKQVRVTLVKESIQSKVTDVQVSAALAGPRHLAESNSETTAIIDSLVINFICTIILRKDPVPPPFVAAGAACKIHWPFEQCKFSSHGVARFLICFFDRLSDRGCVFWLAAFR